MRRLLDPLLDCILASATVGSVGVARGRVLAITLTGDDIAGLEVTPGQQIRIQVNADNRVVDRLAGALRTYSSGPTTGSASNYGCSTTPARTATAREPGGHGTCGRVTRSTCSSRGAPS
ncbi:hypothetical protein NX794_05820 [Streptomyces sp. LP11]|uniref:Uncharacterized protein n=1 Tax=Streptomyces pyxinicus TaxID=2970331 RepID=A0ABT2AWW3_9ACTN|nr:hypothetical protein [Streptomyces sp. LP11]MCS0600748.1 hypothetical protein [Streptomyces sp. LP11]